MRFAYKATRPDFMKDKAQWIWACSSWNCSSHKDIYNQQELRKALPLSRSPSNLLGVAGFNPHACIWRVEFISIGAGVLGVMTGFSGVRISFKPGMFCNNWRMSSSVFCCIQACSLASKSPDSSLETQFFCFHGYLSWDIIRSSGNGGGGVGHCV